MPKKPNTFLYSEKTMAAVNGLFFLSLLIRRRGIVFAAYALWMLYLYGCIRRTASKSVRLIYGLFFVFAAVMFCVNLFFLLK